MAEGTVKWYDKKKGYGFILDQDGRDIFVHYSCFADPQTHALSEGEHVVYDVEQGEKGLKATNIKRT